MTNMLPKPVYSKIIQALKKMKQAWDEDRAEDPKRAPYEIDSELKRTIEREMREGRVSMNNAARDQEIKETFAYLVKQGVIVGSYWVNRSQQQLSWTPTQHSSNPYLMH